MIDCDCKETHQPRRVVLTGGPGAGKTAVLELIRQAFCKHVTVLPEAAGILFGGGFPRGNTPDLERPAQRAIFFTQRELEATADAGNAAIVLCDRAFGALALVAIPEPQAYVLVAGLVAQAAAGQRTLPGPA